VTFNKADALRETATRVPMERLLVETDAPYLAPVPKRGKRNEPAFVVHTAEKLAEIKQVEAEVLARITTENFFTLFSKANGLGQA
jgi:TatD DNase family protein